MRRLGKLLIALPVLGLILGASLLPRQLFLLQDRASQQTAPLGEKSALSLTLQTEGPSLGQRMATIRQSGYQVVYLEEEQMDLTGDEAQALGQGYLENLYSSMGYLNWTQMAEAQYFADSMVLLDPERGDSFRVWNLVWTWKNGSLFAALFVDDETGSILSAYGESDGLTAREQLFQLGPEGEPVELDGDAARAIADGILLATVETLSQNPVLEETPSVIALDPAENGDPGMEQGMACQLDYPLTWDSGEIGVLTLWLGEDQWRIMGR